GKAIAAGIGFFIGFIALKNVGLVIQSAHTMVALGNIFNPAIGFFFLGFFLIAILEARGVPGSILIGMLCVSVLGWITKVSSFHGFLALPPSLAPNFMQLNLKGLLNWDAVPVIFTFVIVALFDSTGTILGLSHHLGLPRDEKLYRKMNRSLVAESLGTVLGAALGATTTSPFVESAAGIRAGGKSGITAITVGVLFLGLLFFAPVAESIPTFATSAALFYVACLMVKPFSEVNWQAANEYIPATITLLTIPLTFSIADGVGFGLLCYLILTVAVGSWRKIHPMIWLLALIFVAYFLADGMSTGMIHVH
ncbi:MAG: NCS2 family permease, partial [Gammaproteobacteria bacterium]|nr:NCS2 family permease [Gammaproteobacteria bacterium]